MRRPSRAIVVSWLVGACLAVAGPAAALDIALVPASSAGPTATLDLVVSGLGASTAPSIGAFDLDLVFDPSAIDVTAVVFGGGLGNPLSEAFSQWIAAPGVSNLSEVSLLPAASLDALQPASFVLAQIDVALLGSAPAAIDFGAVLVGDAFGRAIVPVTTRGATVGAVVPEPTGLLTFAAGLAVAVARLRRR